jgi:hypothetical protein
VARIRVSRLAKIVLAPIPSSARNIHFSALAFFGGAPPNSTNLTAEPIEKRFMGSRKLEVHIYDQNVQSSRQFP